MAKNVHYGGRRDRMAADEGGTPAGRPMGTMTTGTGGRPRVRWLFGGARGAVLTSTLGMSSVEPRWGVLGGLCLAMLSVAVVGRPREGAAGPPAAADVADAEAVGPGE